MTAPSNANTSGLEVVKLANSLRPFAHHTEGSLRIDMNEVRNVIAVCDMVASAQARIDAAEARVDRLAERLRADPAPEQLEPFARKWCIDNGIDPDAPKAPHGEWPEWYDACGPFAAMWRDLARAALQQEG